MALADDTPDLPPMTIEEFLNWDGGGHQGKLILVNGHVGAMSPASATHGLIQANISGELRSHLRKHGLPCRVGTETPVIPSLARGKSIRVPDVAITCSPPSDSKVFEDPLLIVEVMSPTNRKQTEESLETMTGILSVKEILVVESEEVLVQDYRRGEDGGWPTAPSQETRDVKASVRLESIGLDLALSDIYWQTHLATGQA
ncbi:MAG: Uma2 family endonuclease [Alphaproteobacteria bacterium]|nr:Uma2 family endonuclease [Alphaproteobacteria bacterium]